MTGSCSAAWCSGATGSLFGCVVLGWWSGWVLGWLVLGRDGTDGDAGSLLPADAVVPGGCGGPGGELLLGACRLLLVPVRRLGRLARALEERQLVEHLGLLVLLLLHVGRARAEAEASLASSSARSDFDVAAARAFVAADCCAAIDSTCVLVGLRLASTRADRSGEVRDRPHA